MRKILFFSLFMLMLSVSVNAWELVPLTESTIAMADNAFIRVGQNGTLVVNGGIVNNARIATMQGGNVIINNNGAINKASGESFNVPQNASMTLQYGTIN